MAKRSYTKTPMKEQAPEIRNQNFDEVALGYTLEEGQLEASRCLQCKNGPCNTFRNSAVPLNGNNRGPLDY